MSHFDLNKLGEMWPNTGRSCPQNAKLEVSRTHPKWRDLCWWHERRQCWIYMSTLPFRELKYKDE